jgi:hypothetical protein
MLSLYRKVTVTAARRAAAAWPVALSLVVYVLIIFAAVQVALPLGGWVGGFLLGFVVAACWSSYLELISQAVAGSKIRINFQDFRRTFGVRLWDVISVMFAFWIISFLTRPLVQGTNGDAIAAILGFAMAFFFNAVPELLYLGHSRSFALLMDSARFVMAHPAAWLLPNVVFAAIALGASGNLAIHHPAEALILFGTTFSSPAGVLMIVSRLPRWSLPLVLAGLHFVMVFRGVLFTELASGGGNARLRAFQAKMRG